MRSPEKKVLGVIHRNLRDNECAQMICCMLIRGKRDSRGHGPEHVDEVLRDKKKYGHTAKSLDEYVRDYTTGGCGIAG